LAEHSLGPCLSFSIWSVSLLGYLLLFGKKLWSFLSVSPRRSLRWYYNPLSLQSGSAGYQGYGSKIIDEPLNNWSIAPYRLVMCWWASSWLAEPCCEDGESSNFGFELFERTKIGFLGSRRC